MSKKINSKSIWLFCGYTVLLLIIYLEVFVKANKDFDTYIGASKLLSEGKSCYNVWIILPDKVGLLYYYSPLFAILLTPLTYLPQYLYTLIWICFDIFFLYRVILLVNYYLEISSFSNRNKLFFILLAGICTIRFLLYNLDLGQMTIFLVYASLESARLILENKKWQGAALLALAINIKLLPLTLLFYFIYRGEFKASILVVFFFALFLFLPALFIGVTFNNQLLHDWWNTITDTVDKSIFVDADRESLSGLIPSFFMEIKTKIDLPRNVLSLTAETIVHILNAARGLLVLFTVYFLRELPFKQTNKLNHFYSLSYILLITPLIAPHQGKYAYFYLLPAFCFLIYRVFHLVHSQKQSQEFRLLLREKIALTGIVISFTLLTLTTDGIIGRHYSDIADYYHAITIGTLILIVPMAILKPKMAQIAEITAL